MYNLQILKRDLAILEDWLDELAKARPKADAKEPVDYKAAGKRFRNRTRSTFYSYKNIFSIISNYFTFLDIN